MTAAGFVQHRGGGVRAVVEDNDDSQLPALAQPGLLRQGLQEGGKALGLVASRNRHHGVKQTGLFQDSDSARWYCR